MTREVRRLQINKVGQRARAVFERASGKARGWPWFSVKDGIPERFHVERFTELGCNLTKMLNQRGVEGTTGALPGHRDSALGSADLIKERGLLSDMCNP